MVNSSEGAKKGRDTRLAKDPDTYKKMRAKRTNYEPTNHFKDPAKAKEAINKRWAKERENRNKRETADS